MNGYLGKLLAVDLTTGRIEEQPIDPADLRLYLGGASLGAHLLYSRLTASLDPLSPENPLLFITGPLTGTAGPSVGRYTICAKSPATGLWAESNCGGFVGPEIRFAGYDGILFTGKAPAPVYLWLHNHKAELREASHLWGKADTYETQTIIKKEVGESLARVACIGAAGEQLIPFALVLGDHGRVAGRTGMGAVMGSKNLKAVAVRGSGGVPTAEALFKDKRSRANVELRSDNMTRVLRDMGSSGATEYFDLIGSLPSYYYSRNGFAEADKVSGAAMHETILTGVSTCHACVIACGRKVTLTEGPFARGEGKGPEYETIVGFGPNIGNGDLGAIVHLGQLCDSYGLDTISASNTIGLAFALYQQGLITPADTGGLALEWGNVQAAEALIHALMQGEGLGQWLRLGARALGRRFGAEEQAVQVNGLEVAYHDPRGFTGMALSYATSPRGACHNQSDYFIVEMGQTAEEIGITMLDRAGSEGKAANVARHQWWRSLTNALVICIFANVPFETVWELTNLATGFDYSRDEFLESGRRAWNLKRAVNNRMGLTRANDKLPKALLQAHDHGGALGIVPDLELMLKEYYEYQEWDAATGRPCPDLLRRLQLDEPARDLWGAAG